MQPKSCWPRVQAPQLHPSEWRPPQSPHWQLSEWELKFANHPAAVPAVRTPDVRMNPRRLSSFTGFAVMHSGTVLVEDAIPAEVGTKANRWCIVKWICCQKDLKWYSFASMFLWKQNREREKSQRRKRVKCAVCVFHHKVRYPKWWNVIGNKFCTSYHISHSRLMFDFVCKMCDVWHMFIEYITMSSFSVPK